MISTLHFYNEEELPVLKGLYAIVDSDVERIYGKYFDFEYKLTLSLDESTKSLKSVEKICSFLFDNGANRESLIYVIGGGVLLDTAGFAAAIYMRGIDWAAVPTTLLAFADSAVGGKTGVNFNAKNILGSFHAPRDICFFERFLYSLDRRQIDSGVGEIVKTAFLNEDIFEFLSKDPQCLAERNISFLFRAARKCAEFKTKICEEDFVDTSVRNRLNIGHTVGHAIEYSYGLAHGESVLWGLKIESKMFEDMIDRNFLLRTEALLDEVLGDRELPNIDCTTLAEKMRADKKNKEDKIGFVVARNFGRVDRVYESFEEVREKLYAYFENRPFQ